MIGSWVGKRFHELIWSSRDLGNFSTLTVINIINVHSFKILLILWPSLIFGLIQNYGLATLINVQVSFRFALSTTMQLAILGSRIQLISKHWLQHQQGILINKWLILDSFLPHICHIALYLFLAGMIKEIRSSNKLEIGLLCWILLINLFRGVLWHAMYVADVNLEIVFVLRLRSLFYSSRSTITLIVWIYVKGCLAYIQNNAKGDRIKNLNSKKKIVKFHDHYDELSQFWKGKCIYVENLKLASTWLELKMDVQDK